VSAPVSASQYDVVIVGFGPSGAVAAALLGQAGVSTLVVERGHDVYDKPRAIALDHEIMRVFQQLGIVDRVLPHTEPFTPSEYFGADGQLIKRLATVEPPYPLGYTPSLVFNQPAIENVLREHVAGLDSVHVAYGTEFVALEQDADRVTLSLRNDASASMQVQARYAIGCDGASSSLRAAVGIALDDLVFDEPWLVVDVLVNERGNAKLPVTSVQYCEPERPCTFVIGPKNHRRWEISLLPGEDPKAMATETGAWRLLERWITPEDGRLWRQASYRFHALVAADWRAGRVFVAGDAAHQQPPFLGQGMCQGIRDVANLAWKLRAVLEGRAGDALLDTYGAERGRHVRELTGRIKQIGSVICERDPVRARERDARLLAEAGGTVKTQARQDILPALDCGLLSPRHHAANGTLFPQPRLAVADGTVLMDGVAGHGWRVVTSLPLEEIPLEFRERVRNLGTLVCVSAGKELRVTDGAVIQAAEVDRVLAGWFARYDCNVAFVRPDHYVYGAADGHAEAESLLVAVLAQFSNNTKDRT
jgi:3-(3-hydroxy-phenyl)propionate hydroxylase